MTERTTHDSQAGGLVTAPWLVFGRYALPLAPGANHLTVRYDSRSLPSVTLRTAEAVPSWSGTVRSNAVTVCWSDAGC